MVERFIGVSVQADYTTKNSPPDEFISGLDESITHENNPVAEEEMAGRFECKPVPGGFRPDGGLNFFVEPENCTGIFYGAFGKVTTTEPTAPGQGDYQHSFEPADLLIAKYLSVMIGTGLGTADSMRTYVGCFVKSLKLSMDQEKKLLAAVDLVNQTVALEDESAVSPSFSAINPFYFREATGEVDTVLETKIISMEINIENGVDDGDIRMGSRLRQSAQMGGIEVTGTMDLSFDDMDYTEEVLGTLGASGPEDSLDDHTIELLIDTGDLIVAGGVNRQLNITMTGVTLVTDKANVNKQERIIQNVEFKVYSNIVLDLFNSIPVVPIP